MKLMITEYVDTDAEPSVGYPHAHDMALPVRDVGGVAHDLPDPLGGSVHLDGELGRAHPTWALPLDQPRHHTNRDGASRTSAPASGSISVAIPRADFAPLPTSSRT